MRRFVGRLTAITDELTHCSPEAVALAFSETALNHLQCDHLDAGEFAIVRDAFNGDVAILRGGDHRVLVAKDEFGNISGSLPKQFWSFLQYFPFA